MNTRRKSAAEKKPFDDREQLKLLVKIAFSLVLVIYFIAITVQRVDLGNDYAALRNQMAGGVEKQITLFLRECDSAIQPGANLQNDILPDLQKYYYAMVEMDDALGYAYGTAYTFVPEDLRSHIKLTLSAYDQAFRNGKPTESADSSLKRCASSLRMALEGRFNTDGEVLPKQ